MVSTRGNITIRTIDYTDEPVDDAEFAIQLRHRTLKLRWIGCEAEAAAIAGRLKRLHLDARGFSPPLLDTD